MPLSRERARRFAQMLLDQNCHEGQFDIVMPSADVDLVADVFQNDLLCKIEVDRLKRRITVFCS